jgi:cold-inducible RNA-binding protein
MKIFVGNLSFHVTDNDLRSTFEPFGEVTSAGIVRDRDSGESRGFAFIDMPNQSEAQKAIDELNGKELLGRIANVNEARPMAARPRSGGGNYSSHRGGGGANASHGGGHSGGGHSGPRKRPDYKRGGKSRFNRRSY